eukprot:9841101-Lingulodinium_polyedra.AAC.1
MAGRRVGRRLREAEQVRRPLPQRPRRWTAAVAGLLGWARQLRHQRPPPPRRMAAQASGGI